MGTLWFSSAPTALFTRSHPLGHFDTQSLFRAPRPNLTSSVGLVSHALLPLGWTLCLGPSGPLGHFLSAREFGPLRAGHDP